MQSDGGITEQRVQRTGELFDGLDLTKEQLIRLLSETLVHGGLTDQQIDELINDWRYLKDKI